MPTLSDNLCGECNVCCGRFSIPEVTWMGDEGKPKDTLCDKSCNGCTIYDERPEPCVAFECVWLKINKVRGDDFPVSLRPDNTNIMVLARKDDEAGSLIIDEVQPNSVDLMNMSPPQSILVSEIINLISNQEISTSLYFRSYDWEVSKVNFEITKDNDNLQQDKE